MTVAAAAPLVTSMFMIESWIGSCADGTDTLAGADGLVFCGAGGVATGSITAAGDLAPAGAPLRALDRVDAVPDRRVRLLQRLELDRNVVEGEKLAFEIEPLLREALEDQVDRLGIDPLRLGGVLSVQS